MIALRLRPGFRQELDFGVDEARERIVAQVEAHPEACELLSFPGYVVLRIPPEDRHFWSPRLLLGLEPNGEGRTEVRGLFGPNASMWSSYLYGYLFVGMTGVLSGIFGLCQLALEMMPWGLWITATMSVIALLMFLAALIGQRLALPQSELLERIYVEAVGKGVEVH